MIPRSLGAAQVLLGFVRVLVVIRPGASGFGWAALLPVGSSLAWAVAIV